MSPKIPAKVLRKFFMVSSSLCVSPVVPSVADALIPLVSSEVTCDARRINPFNCCAVCSTCWVNPPPVPDPEASLDPIDPLSLPLLPPEASIPPEDALGILGLDT